MALVRGVVGAVLLSSAMSSAEAAVAQPPLLEIVSGLEQGCQRAERQAHPTWSRGQLGRLCHCMVQTAQPELAKLHAMLGVGQGDVLGQAERVSEAMTVGYAQCLGQPWPLDPAARADQSAS